VNKKGRKNRVEETTRNSKKGGGHGNALLSNPNNRGGKKEISVRALEKPGWGQEAMRRDTLILHSGKKGGAPNRLLLRRGGDIPANTFVPNVSDCAPNYDT